MTRGCAMITCLRRPVGLLLVCCVGVLILTDQAAARLITANCESTHAYIRCFGTIEVHGTIWGRLNTYLCRRGNTATTSCAERQRSYATVKRLCQGKTYCHFQVNTATFGDPCPGYSKYLRISYDCKPPPTPPTIGPPAVVSASGCKTPGSKADIYFVVDSSGSIRRSNFVYMLRFMNWLVNSFPIGRNDIRIGLIRFSSQSQLIFPLNRYYTKSAIKHAIRYLPYQSGGTSASTALALLRNVGFTARNGDRIGVHNMAVLITDGVPNYVHRTMQQAYACKKAGIEFFIIAVQAPPRAVSLLKKIAHTAHAHYYVLPKFNLMQKQASGIGKQVCSTVNKFNRPKKGSVRGCKQNVPADIYFLIDSSGSVTSKNFPFMLKFISAMIDSLPLGQKTTRVGVYRYEHRVNLMISLDKYYNKAKLKKAVMSIKYSKGMTFTDQVLKAMRTSGFTAKNGARKGVLDIGVLITDGLSTFRTKTLQETKLCKKAGIQLFAIGVAVPTNVEIKEIGSKPKKDHVFTIKHFPDLLHKARDIHHKMCENINKANKPCKKNRQVDLYFVVDSSENLQKANFPKALAFINSVIDSLPIGQNDVRVGLMIYDFVAKLMFPLNKHFTAANLKAAVSQVKFTGGGCSIFDALKAIRTVGFTVKNGDRPGVHNMAILISSGIPYGYPQTLSEAQATKKAGVELFVVGAGVSSMSQLNKLASAPVKDHVFSVDKASKLTSKATVYSKLVCKTVNKHPVKTNL